MDRRQQARALVATALAEVEAELAVAEARALPHPARSLPRRRSAATSSAIDAGALPPKRDRDEGLGQMIVDSWPFDLPLGALVLRAERAWRNA